jgi:tetratricopeptide (TPR) repeat protein
MPDSTLSDQTAIAAALTGNWKEAILINLALLKVDKTDVDTLNRLAYAYLKSGEIAAAKRTFSKALDLDPYNGIALKNSKLLSGAKRKSTKGQALPAAAPSAFLEDPGKTKIVSCVNLAPAQSLMTLSPGQMVDLKPRKHAVEIRSDKTYLAALPDDVTFKLLKLLAAGNTYQVVVKAVGKNMLTVILRELSRGKRFANQPSFISTTATSYTPFAPAEVHPEEKPSVVATGEEDLEEEDKTEEKEPEEEVV